MCSTSSLRRLCILIGAVFALSSLAGIVGSVYLMFGGEELDHYTSGTYSPSWEDIGPAMLSSVVSVIINVLLVGGAVLYSHKMLMVWIVWDIALLIIFWAWFSYSYLKHNGYIEFDGMKGCYFCYYPIAAQTVTTSGAAISGAIIASLVVVIAFYSKCKKQSLDEAQSSAYIFQDDAAPGQFGSLQRPFTPASQLSYKQQQEQYLEHQRLQQENYQQQQEQQQYIQQQQQQQLLLQQEQLQQQQYLQQQQPQYFQQQQQQQEQQQQYMPQHQYLQHPHQQPQPSAQSSQHLYHQPLNGVSHGSRAGLAESNF